MYSATYYWRGPGGPIQSHVSSPSGPEGVGHNKLL